VGRGEHHPRCLQSRKWNACGRGTSSSRSLWCLCRDGQLGCPHAWLFTSATDSALSCPADRIRSSAGIASSTPINGGVAAHADAMLQDGRTVGTAIAKSGIAATGAVVLCIAPVDQRRFRLRDSDRKRDSAKLRSTTVSSAVAHATRPAIAAQSRAGHRTSA